MRFPCTLCHLCRIGPQFGGICRYYCPLKGGQQRWVSSGTIQNFGGNTPRTSASNPNWKIVLDPDVRHRRSQANTTSLLAVLKSERRVWRSGHPPHQPCTGTRSDKSAISHGISLTRIFERPLQIVDADQVERVERACIGGLTGAPGLSMPL